MRGKAGLKTEKSAKLLCPLISYEDCLPFRLPNRKNLIYEKRGENPKNS